MIANLSNALTAMFEDAEEHLSDKTLELLQGLTGLDGYLDAQSRNLSETLNTLALLMASEENMHKPGDEELAYVLWGISEQAANIGAMIHVSGSAAYQLEKRQSKKRQATKKPDQ